MGEKPERFVYITSKKPGTLDRRFYHLFVVQENNLYTFGSKFDAMYYAHTTFGTPVVNPTSLKAFIAKQMVWLPNDRSPSIFDGDIFTFTGEASGPGGQHSRLDVWHTSKQENSTPPPRWMP